MRSGIRSEATSTASSHKASLHVLRQLFMALPFQVFFSASSSRPLDDCASHATSEHVSARRTITLQRPSLESWRLSSPRRDKTGPPAMSSLYVTRATPGMRFSTFFGPAAELFSYRYSGSFLKLPLLAASTHINHARRPNEYLASASSDSSTDTFRRGRVSLGASLPSKFLADSHN